MTRRNVILVVLDSVRKDFFDSYATRIQDRSALSYGQCRAASSWSPPSHASMLSGTVPSEHGIHSQSRDFSKLAIEDTFLDNLDGVTKIGVSANAFASEAYNFHTYFDEFRESSETRRYPSGLDPGELVSDIRPDDPRRYLRGLRAIVKHDHPLPSLANAALAELDNLSRKRPIPQPIDDGAVPVLRSTKRLIRETEQPFFAFMNLMDTHIPLRPIRGFDHSLHDAPFDWCSDEKGVWDLMGAKADEYWETREGVYAAAIDYLDRQLASFATWVDEHTELETTLIVTSDHGENHGRVSEHRLANHKSSLSEGILHVPLEVINPPGRQPPVDGLVSHLDLGTLLVGFAHGEVRDVTTDTVVAEHIGMSAGPKPEEDFEYWDRAIRSAHRGTEKYTWDSLGNAARYRVNPDQPSAQEHRGEVTRISPWATQRFEVDITEYKEQIEEHEEQENIERSTKHRLRRLGYLE